MSDVLLGLLAIGVGLVFCFFGFLAMRILIPLWGAFAGFMFGAALIDGITGDGFLGSALGWFVGVAVGLVFGLIAYLYYEISVFIAMAAIGFGLGTSLMVVLGVTWNWAVVLVGVAVGALLALVAIVADLPTIILIVLTALGGANVAVFGLMLMFGAVDVKELDSVATTETVDDSWWWYAIFIGLSIAGIIAQTRETERLTASMRDQWAEAGGKQLRHG
jgi:hypothetical protein